MGQRNKPSRRCRAPERHFAGPSRHRHPARLASHAYNRRRRAARLGEQFPPEVACRRRWRHNALMGRDRGEQATPDLFSTETVRDGSPSPIKPIPATQLAATRPRSDMCCRRTCVKLSSTWATANWTCSTRQLSRKWGGEADWDLAFRPRSRRHERANLPLGGRLKRRLSR